jgi:hypothetical protein
MRKVIIILLVAVMLAQAASCFASSEEQAREIAQFFLGIFMPFLFCLGVSMINRKNLQYKLRYLLLFYCAIFVYVYIGRGDYRSYDWLGLILCGGAGWSAGSLISLVCGLLAGAMAGAFAQVMTDWHWYYHYAWIGGMCVLSLLIAQRYRHHLHK